MDSGNRIRISSSGDIIIGNRMMKLIASSILAISFMMMMFWSKNGGADTNIYGTAQHRQLSIPLQQFIDPKSTGLRTTESVSTHMCNEMSRLDQVREFHNVFKQMNTDKTYSHGYQWYYGPHLAPYRNKPNVRLLEIGAQNGHSAAGWSEYFNDASIDMLTYGGNDNKLKFDAHECELGNCDKIHMFFGDQSDTDMLKDMARQRPDGWDIIVDDASHVPQHNIITFETLWKHIKPGGLYVVEDIQTSYWPNAEIYGYPINAGISAPSPRNALQRFKQYADVINRGYWGEQNEGFSYFEGDHEIEEIGFSRNIIFIRKALDSSAVDATGNPYHHYPTIPVGAKSQGSMITQDLNQAMYVFKEQSKELDPWLTAPSLQQAMAASE